MIVIAIVAILVALAVPAYQDYTIRAKVGECVNAAAVPKLAISEYFETTGTLPTFTQAGMLGQGNSQYCDAYEVGTYVATASTSASFNIVVDEASTGVSCTNNSACTKIEPMMTGTPNTSGGVDWRCSFGATDAADIKFLPATCRSAT